MKNYVIGSYSNYILKLLICHFNYVDRFRIERGLRICGFPKRSTDYSENNFELK